MDSSAEQLYNTYYMSVYSFVMTLAKNRELAEEITQKTFFKALTAVSKHRGEASELTWLCSIAKNLFADELRAQSGLAPLSDEQSAAESFEETLLDREAALRVHRALHELPEPYKEVFSLRVFGELPFAKIALIFGKTENWARVTYHRARLKLIERMELL
ncbi:MAG: RNA polymerase sigma factor [Oscillospiraceae bacterium]|jgi:RNA polymerase sigma-70 factor (ECF subfamily)|nr:RNA polymerase sigma factor [Oscillospiraceae bacterium]